MANMMQRLCDSPIKAAWIGLLQLIMSVNILVDWWFNVHWYINVDVGIGDGSDKNIRAQTRRLLLQITSSITFPSVLSKIQLQF